MRKPSRRCWKLALEKLAQQGRWDRLESVVEALDRARRDRMRRDHGRLRKDWKIDWDFLGEAAVGQGLEPLVRCVMRHDPKQGARMLVTCVKHRCQPEIALGLLAGGASPSARDERGGGGEPVLCMVARLLAQDSTRASSVTKPWMKVLIAPLDAGANPASRNAQGQTALDLIAKNAGCGAARAILESRVLQRSTPKASEAVGSVVARL